jgi:hypothetical protein
MTMTATYSGEELNVTFVASTERCDYGVEGSPVWYEVNPDNRILQDLGIDGPPHLRLQAAIFALCERSGV